MPAGDKPADDGGSITEPPEVVNDQAVTVEPVEPVMPVRRAGLVPVSAAAFVLRDGSSFASEGGR